MRRMEISNLVFVTGAAAVLLLLLNHDSSINTGSNHWNNDHLKLTGRRTSEVLATTRRKLKETNSMTKARSTTKVNAENLNVEDYPQFDPTPNSKASIKNGPIEHGTPLLPYVPQPTVPFARPRPGSRSAPGPLGQPVFSPPPYV